MKKKQLLLVSIFYALRISSIQIAITAVFCSTLYAHTANSQDILQKTFSITVENTQLKKILKEIEKQTKVKFTYSVNVINAEQEISYTALNKPIGLFLNALKADYHIDFKIVGERIVLFSNVEINSSAEKNLENSTEIPKRIISGKVTDENGMPLQGVSVLVKGTSTGTTTDANGSFRIELPEKASKILVFSFIGKELKEVNVSDRDAIIVSLKTKNELSEETVVVTAYGIKRQSRELGYSTSTLSSKDLNQAQVIDATSGMIGKVSGLTIQTQDNNLAPSYSLNLRGNRSITGNNSAIVVLDGAIVQPYILGSLNPNDIESTNILKGSAASALYGAYGNNGVLVITTKKPKPGKTEVNYKSSVQVERISYLPKLQNEYGGWGGETTYIDPITGQPQNVPYENQQYGPKYDGHIVDIGTPKRVFNPDGTFRDTVLKATYSPKKGARTGLFQTGLTYINDISVSTSTPTTALYVAYQKINRTDILPGDKLNKDFFKVNTSGKYGILNLDLSAAYTRTVIDQSLNRGNIYSEILNSPAHVDLNQFKNGFFYSLDNYYNAWNNNPWWDINNKRNKSTDDKLVSNVFASINVIKDLIVSYRLGYTYSSYQYKNTTNGYNYSQYEQSNPYKIAGGDNASNIKTLLPTTDKGSTFENRLTGDFNVSYKKDFNRDLSVKVIAGHSFTKDNYNTEDLNATLAFNNFYNISSYVGQQNASEYAAARLTQGVYADLSFSFRNYLYLHGSVRNDWTSVLTQHRIPSYGSVDAAFILSDAFPKYFSGKVINFAKLRLSGSTTGQVNLSNVSTYGAYLTKPSFNIANAYPYNNSVGYALNSLYPNSALRPEKTKEIEGGIELSFLDNRVNYQGAVYEQTTSGQTIPGQISQSTGYSSQLVNSGVTTNFGIENDCKVTVIRNNGTGWRWDLGANYTYIRNRIKSMPQGNELYMTNDAYAEVGMAFPALKVTDITRDPATGKAIVDANGYPLRDNNYKIMGAVFQPYRLGLNTSVTYKNLNLSIVADYRGGGVIFNQIGQLLDWTGSSAHSTYGNRQRFVFPNSVYDDGSGHYVNNTSRQIANVFNFWTTYSTLGTPYVTSNAFWKLREVVLTYTVPAEVIRRTRYIRNLTIGITGRNLLMWRPKENIWTDPEFNMGGNYNANGTTNSSQTPPTRFYGVNINVSL